MCHGPENTGSPEADVSICLCETYGAIPEQANPVPVFSPLTV